MNNLSSKEELKKEIERKRKLAVFLKRKRLENHLTLEELCKGVCTVSYLSRIENNVVDVGDEYFTLLFKKLDIDYNMLKETKNDLVLDDILKAYLKNDLSLSVNITNEALNTEYYVDLEYELMVLYNNIMYERFQEAKESIIN